MQSVVSFFCGCGGLDLGFRGDFAYHGHRYPRTCFNILSAYDNNPDAVATYNENVGNHAHTLDLTNYDPGQIAQADVLIGGFPCQDFSSCGPRRGLTSVRGRLYEAMLKYAHEHQPKVIVGENVIGLSNINGGAILQKIVDDVEACGYHVRVWNMFAPDYGIPQRRTRLIIVAVRNDIDGFPEEPERVFDVENYHTTRWAIGDLENVVDETVPNQSQYFKASRAKKGNGQGDETSPADAPSYTIRANAKSRVQFHYAIDRRLTVRECARIQTFPDNFVFRGSMTKSVMQIGNAVPPMLANKVAVSVQRFLEERDEH